MYHAMIRRFHPRTVIEVGSGWATRAALEAIRRNGTGRLLCIDPEPRHGLPRAVEYRRAFVERVELELFDTLEANDILFIDSSHTAEEAAYHVQTILPRLKPGVYVHHHDIFYPYAPLYAEEEVLRRYYGTAASAFDLCCGLAFVRERDPDLWRALCPRSRLFPQQVPGSLWSRKRG